MNNKFEKLHMQSTAYLMALVEEMRNTLRICSGLNHYKNCQAIDDFGDVTFPENCDCYLKKIKEALGE